MGHERVGVLPKSQRWRDVVALIANSALSETDVATIASRTTANLRQRLRNIPTDDGIRAAFKFLVALSVASRTNDPTAALMSLGINVTPDPSPLTLTRAAHDWVDDNRRSLEYAQIAQNAVGDAIAIWTDKNKTRQTRLIEQGDRSFEVWYKSANGAGFCELSRIFFAKFTERYLSYFLEREASAVIPNFQDRDRFQHQLREHVDSVSQNAFETAKITQSFAAGWFNKHANQGMPSDREIAGFLSIAFGKLSEELRREGNLEWSRTLP